MTSERYELVVARSAAWAISDAFAESVAAAAIEFIVGSLLINPQRVGRELRNELSGVHSARRGTYRVLYRIDVEARQVVVLKIEHRGTVYRSV